MLTTQQRAALAQRQTTAAAYLAARTWGLPAALALEHVYAAHAIGEIVLPAAQPQVVANACNRLADPAWAQAMRLTWRATPRALWRAAYGESREFATQAYSRQF